jgi:hypothetical protein
MTSPPCHDFALFKITLQGIFQNFENDSLLLQGIFQIFEMSQVPPDKSCFVGFRCTNKICLRVFNTRGALMRHKLHRTQKNTLCSDKKRAEEIYEIDDNRSLQSSRIVTVPLSGCIPLMIAIISPSCLIFIGYAMISKFTLIYAHLRFFTDD